MPRRTPTKGTLASLAADLGVSRTTVSNAYNHPEELSAGLREKILAAAAARGYPGPDPAARSLRTRRVGSVGVVLTEELTYAFKDLASVDFLAGMAESATTAESALTLIPVGPDTSRKSPLVTNAVVDGFVVYSVAQDDPHLEAVLERGLPTVICGQPGTINNVPFVGIDDHEAIAPAATSLIQAGHRHIGILAIRLFSTAFDGTVSLKELAGADYHIQRDRVKGALDVFERAGIPPETVPVVTRHINDPDNAFDAAAQLLGEHPELTAVLCTTDSMAFGVLSYAQSRGISVPGELSVTGFDGVARALDYGLATVVQPNVDKGVHAGRILNDLLTGVETTSRTLLPTSWHPGTSVSAPYVRKSPTDA